MRQETDQYSRTPNPQPQGMRKRKGTKTRGAQKVTVRSQGCAIRSPNCQKRMTYTAAVRSKPPAIWPIAAADSPPCATVVPIRMSPSRPSTKRVKRPHPPTSRPTAKPRFSVFNDIAIDLHSSCSHQGGNMVAQISPVPCALVRRSRSHAQQQTEYTL